MSVYLPGLHQKTKWVTEELIELKTGDLVWIFDKNMHPFKFPLGRIEVYNSDDQTVKSAVV